jgi:hypothetical protein
MASTSESVFLASVAATSDSTGMTETSSAAANNQVSPYTGFPMRITFCSGPRQWKNEMFFCKEDMTIGLLKKQAMEHFGLLDNYALKHENGGRFLSDSEHVTMETVGYELVYLYEPSDIFMESFNNDATSEEPTTSIKTEVPAVPGSSVVGCLSCFQGLFKSQGQTAPFVQYGGGKRARCVLDEVNVKDTDPEIVKMLITSFKTEWGKDQWFSAMTDDSMTLEKLLAMKQSMNDRGGSTDNKAVRLLSEIPSYVAVKDKQK